MNQTIEIEVTEGETFVVELDGEGSGKIVSTLHYDSPTDIEELFDSTEQYDKYEAMIDAIESLVLAHACAGLDVNSPQYKEGLKTCLNAIANNV